MIHSILHCRFGAFDFSCYIMHQCQLFVCHFFAECVLFSILQDDHSVGKFAGVRAVTAIYVGNHLG